LKLNELFGFILYLLKFLELRNQIQEIEVKLIIWVYSLLLKFFRIKKPNQDIEVKLIIWVYSLLLKFLELRNQI